MGHRATLLRGFSKDGAEEGQSRRPSAVGMAAVPGAWNRAGDRRVAIPNMPPTLRSGGIRCRTVFRAQRAASSIDMETKRSLPSNSARHSPPSGSVAMIDVSVSR
jgi:hypothetical protein